MVLLCWNVFISIFNASDSRQFGPNWTNDVLPTKKKIKWNFTIFCFSIIGQNSILVHLWVIVGLTSCLFLFFGGGHGSEYLTTTQAIEVSRSVAIQKIWSILFNLILLRWLIWKIKGSLYLFFIIISHLPHKKSLWDITVEYTMAQKFNHFFIYL